MNTEQYPLNKWLFCPSTGRQESGESVTAHQIPGGWAMWWRCSSCGHWHMVEILAAAKNCSRRIRQNSIKKGKDYFHNA